MFKSITKSLAAHLIVYSLLINSDKNDQRIATQLGSIGVAEAGIKTNNLTIVHGQLTMVYGQVSANFSHSLSMALSLIING